MLSHLFGGYTPECGQGRTSGTWLSFISLILDKVKGHLLNLVHLGASNIQSNDLEVLGIEVSLSGC
jgi:hypothetical protein